MPNGQDRLDWNTLLQRIQAGKCTPFLGAGVNSGILPLGSKIAEELAKKFHYPLQDSFDLARVAQFLAVTRDAMFPKEEILRLFKKELEEWQRKVTLSEFFKAPDEPLGVLADLPLPIYITTNYDDLMVKALQSRQKNPRREVCRWNTVLRRKFVKLEKPSVFDSACGFEPTPANPVVFHLHGHDEVPESLVLTEDDYLNFLVDVSRQRKLLPPCIEAAMAGASLLFIGYRLADWDFNVLFKGLVGSVDGSSRYMSLSVQLPRKGSEQQCQKEQEYLVKYFGDKKVQVYWGTAKQFAAELRDRWRKFINVH